MSFNLVTAGWIAKIFIIYGLMVLVAPCLLLRKILAGRTTAQKFVICVVAGNFFYITLVLALGLAHLTNRYVLIGATLIIPGIIGIRRRQQLIDLFWRAWNNVFRLVRGENSLRFLARKFFCWSGNQIWSLAGPGVKRVARNWAEWVIFALCSGFVLWYFSITNHFGPRASDLVVHMLWINRVDYGQIYSAGIYPFGMHALIYYIHAVFDIPTVRLILAFGTIQTFYIFIMLLAFLKEICRYRYTPYLAYMAFAVGNFIQSNRYSRYYSTLPQEFGMIFLLPCAVALIRFFRHQKKEEEETRRMKKENLLYTRIDGRQHLKESTLWLWVLIISFGLTLTAHFYITIVAGVLVAAMALVYLDRVFRWAVFRRLAVAGILSLAISIAPMAIAFAGGTPLEGSLYWALEVMGIERETETETETVESEPAAQEDSSQAAVETVQSQPEEPEAAAGEPQEQLPETSLTEKIEYAGWLAKQTSGNFLKNLIFLTEADYQIWKIAMGICAAGIAVVWLMGERERARFLSLVVVYNLLCLFLAISGHLGLPVLIDENRISIFFSYTALVCVSMAVDTLLFLPHRLLPGERPLQFAALILAVGLGGYILTQGRVREKVVNESPYQRDGAALCVYSIMENYPDKKWTIISCNEERNMVSPVAWHYEVIDFLQSMEYYQTGDEMYIPTQYVFFFVEKNVLNYALEPEFTQMDGHVSLEWAAYELPRKNGLSQYSGTERIIVNSRMYYWAQEYMERYPNEMKIYYEDEDFVCYFIEQNEYYLNNFAIDYGYNSGDGMYAE